MQCKVTSFALIAVIASLVSVSDARAQHETIWQAPVKQTPAVQPSSRYTNPWNTPASPVTPPSPSSVPGRTSSPSFPTHYPWAVPPSSVYQRDPSLRSLTQSPKSATEEVKAQLSKYYSGIAIPNPTTRLEKQQEEIGGRILKEANDRMTAKEKTIKQCIADVDKRTEQDVRAVPRQVYIGSKSMPNPNYDAEVDEIRRQGSEKQRKLRWDLERSKQDILRAAQRKIDDLKRTARHLDEQTKSQQGAVGLVQKGTTMHVRNYVHFPDQSESDLYAPPVAPLKAENGTR
jgi:hypothetical protein